MLKNARLCLLGLTLAPLLLRGAEEDPYAFRKSRDLSSIEFTSENDLFGFKGSDKYYTNGFKLAYVTPSLNQEPSVWNYRAHFGFAQEIYNASDKSLSNPPFGDHPYSAWLYGMAGLGWEDNNTLDLLTLRAGIVGPSALGRQIQNNYHHLIGAEPAKGWDTQLKDEPGIDLEWRRVWRTRLTGEGDGLGTDLLPRIGIEIGTVRTFGSLGVQYRFGNNLPLDFGVRSSRDTSVDGAPVKFSGNGGFAPDSYYGFVDVQAEAWAWNMAIDGNMYHSGNGVPREDFVGQVGIGFAIQWGGTRLSLGEYLRTKEFEDQDGAFYFGSVSINVAF